MHSESIRYLIVPGWQGSPEDHWQTHWQNSLPNSARVEQDDWLTPRREDWVAALAEAMQGAIDHADGMATDATPQLLAILDRDERLVLAGAASAWVFVAGGLLAARLGSWYPRHSGLMLGIVYGGVGWGIVLSALVVPVVLAHHASQPHGWAWAWWWTAWPWAKPKWPPPTSRGPT